MKRKNWKKSWEFVYKKRKHFIIPWKLKLSAVREYYWEFYIYNLTETFAGHTCLLSVYLIWFLRRGCTEGYTKGNISVRGYTLNIFKTLWDINLGGISIENKKLTCCSYLTSPFKIIYDTHKLWHWVTCFLRVVFSSVE